MTQSNLTKLTLGLLLAAGMHAGAAHAQRSVDTCGADGKLRPPSIEGVNLVIKGDPGPNGSIVPKTCTVPANTYKFGNVNILEGGTLKFEDAVIDFWASGILIEKGGAVIAGEDAPIGTNGGVVTLHLWGKDANAAGTRPDAQGLGITCLSEAAKDTPANPPADKPAAPCGIPYDLWYKNLDMSMAGMSMPVPPAKAAPISTVTFPPGESYPAGQTGDYFYAYHPLTYDGAADPLSHRVGYFGYKVLGVSYGGTLRLFGRKGATYDAPACPSPAITTSGSSWVRLAADADSSMNTLTVDRPVTLKAGDEIVVTATDYVPGNSEQLTVAADVTCGTTITLKSNPLHHHSGTRFPLSSVPPEVGLDAKLHADGAETRAAVGLLTRSIRIVSAGDTLNDNFPDAPVWIPNAPPPAPGYFFGGQVIARQGFKSFQVQGVEFKQLGQGGKIGHYPIHFHHARMTAANTFVRDSSIHDSMTRWIVLHGTQGVTLERNVGYKSIGHGFYFEDGTEINNVLTANLGVFARAAVRNAQNPRQVPGILAASDLHTTQGDDPAFRSDYTQPTVFWIMNAYNEFRDNAAVGAGTCGACYWMLPGVISTMSREMKWASYASIQSTIDRAGSAPLKSFVGNSCSTAMISFQTITKTQICLGIGPGAANGGPVADDSVNLPPIYNPLAPPSVPPPGSNKDQIAAANAAAANYYPTIGDGGRFPTRCDAEDCSSTPADRCSPGHTDSCEVTVLDRYTTSFNWAGYNFAAIWLRPQWYLVTDSVITDVQNAGLTMVTGGGYSDSDVIPGHWALVRKSVFIGNTQDNNPYASNGGPFNPKGLKCDLKNNDRPGDYCLNKAEGISHQISNLGMNQRLFNVYDGPAFQDSNAYLNISRRTIDDCNIFVDFPAKVGRCDPDFSLGPRKSAWISGNVLGLLKARPDLADPKKDYCYMPNAAIGWKQPNGFYYPPAFHSANLYFDNVDIRHFVITPLFNEGTSTTNFNAVKDAYCNWSSDIFKGFAGNDRQTVLNDDDGTLTGYAKATVINKDQFFNAPVDALQCLSDATSRTSPYEYVTTVLYPACVITGTCAKPPDDSRNPPEPNWNSGDWNRACTNENCYGVPLWRQDRMPIADKGQDKSIRMMGQETGQRSTLTVNHGTYYLDTTVDKATQLDCGSTDAKNPCVINLFKENETYYLFLIYAKANTEQTYRFYVGENTSFDPSSIQIVQAPIGLNPIIYKTIGSLPAGRAQWLGNDKATAKGVVEVVLRVADLAVPDKTVAQLFDDEKEAMCKPSTYCTWDADSKSCKDKAGGNAVCKWAGADVACPSGGCYGIKFTLPSGFATLPPNAPSPRPPAVCLAKAGPWDVNLDSIEVPEPGVCPKESDKLPLDFCR